MKEFLDHSHLLLSFDPCRQGGGGGRPRHIDYIPEKKFGQIRIKREQKAISCCISRRLSLAECEHNILGIVS